jgi:hypothetical protein
VGSVGEDEFVDFFCIGSSEKITQGVEIMPLQRVSFIRNKKIMMCRPIIL